jgi:hypothetical protein
VNTVCRAVLFGFFVAAANRTAQAGISAPLHIGTTNAVVDERGRMLPGSSASAALFNQPVITGARVEIIRTYNGLIDPPNTNGIPAGTNNAIITTTRIGNGVDPAAGMTGQFGLSLPNYDGSQIFVRVFNATEIAGASFYANSQVYSPAAGYSVFIPTLTAVQPIDSNDNDSDGLVNSWEKSLNTNPNSQDTDGDGINDYAEFLSGTDANDPGSYLKMVQVQSDLNGNAIVYWASVIGKTYQLQFSAGDLAASPAFADIGNPVTATDTTTQIIHTGGITNTAGHYRVKLIP